MGTWHPPSSPCSPSLPSPASPSPPLPLATMATTRWQGEATRGSPQHQPHPPRTLPSLPLPHLSSPPYLPQSKQGLVDTLAGVGPFTVFAPTNDAFAKVPKDALNSLLADKDALTAVPLRHVVPGAALTAQDVPVGSTDVKTAGGEEITVTRGDYIKVKSSAGEAGVVAFDVLATNGVVHLVDTVF